MYLCTIKMIRNLIQSKALSDRFDPLTNEPIKSGHFMLFTIRMLEKRKVENFTMI